MSALGDQSTSTSGERQRSHGIEAPPPPSRRRVWMTLGALLVVQGVVCLFVSPFHAVPAGVIVSRIYFAALGAVLAQPMFWAIVTVFGPGGWLVRYSAGIVFVATLGLLSINSALWTNIDSKDVFEAIGFYLLPFVFVQAPLLGLRWMRGWRMVQTGAQQVDRVHPPQFSLRWLLAIVTGVAIVFAIGRTFVVLAQSWRSAQWRVDLIFLLILTLGVSIPSLCATPLVVAALGTKRRAYGLCGALAGLVGVASVVYWLERDNSDALETVVLFLPTAWIWIFLNLWVLRWCGFRLVRDVRDASADGALADDDAELPE